MFKADIVQVCYVVKELDVAVDHWIDTLGAGPFFVAENMTGIPADYKGVPSTMDISLALGQAGALQIELIQINSASPSCYRDMYSAGQVGFHHVATFVDDFEQTVIDFAEKGYEMNTRCLFLGEKVAYMDTRASIGGFTELYEKGPGIQGFYRDLIAAAENWDGKIRTYPLESLIS